MSTYRVSLRGENLCINPLYEYYPGRPKIKQYRVFPGTPALEAFSIDVDSGSESEAVELARVALETARLDHIFS